MSAEDVEAGAVNAIRRAQEEARRPEYGTEDYRRFAVLFNDITLAPTEQFVHFGTRNILADYLWSQGWRREVRPDDFANQLSKADVLRECADSVEAIHSPPLPEDAAAAEQIRSRAAQVERGEQS